MKKIKIVIISEANEFGVREHLIGLMKSLLYFDNVELYFICSTLRFDSVIQSFLDNNSIIKVYKIKSLQRKISLNDFKAYIKIKKILDDIQPDIVHCHSSKAGFSGRIAAKMSNVNKIIYSPHGYFFLNDQNGYLKNKIYLIAEKILSKTCTSKTILTSIGEYNCYKNNKIDAISKGVLIENGMCLDKFNKYKKNMKKNNNKIIIGWMGRFSDQKDPETMIKIADRLIKLNDNYCFYIAGDGVLFSKVKNYIQNSKVEKNVKFFGVVEDPLDFLSKVDIFLTTSLYEGLPYALISALAMELPIVGTNVVGNADCIENNINGYLFESRNIDEAVELILKIDEKIKRKFGKKSFEIFLHRFEYSIMIQKYYQTYGIFKENKKIYEK